MSDQPAPNVLIQVGDGSGFVVTGEWIITAAHCLPHLPPAHGALSLEERTYPNLLGGLGGERTVWCELVFADPISDLAVLAQPDNQELGPEADAYDDLLDPVDALAIGALMFRPEEHRLPDGGLITGRPKAVAPAHLITLDGKLALVTVASGMSGSPILGLAGAAIGVVSTGTAANPNLMGNLPTWLTARYAAEE